LAAHDNVRRGVICNVIMDVVVVGDVIVIVIFSLRPKRNVWSRDYSGSLCFGQVDPLLPRLLIFCVWVLSFIVCFPPLIGWNERGGLDFTDDVAPRHNWTRPPADDVMQAGRAPEVELFGGDSTPDTRRYDVVRDSATSQATTQQCGDVSGVADPSSSCELSTRQPTVTAKKNKRSE